MEAELKFAHTDNLWHKITSSPNELLHKFKVKGGYSACIFPEPYQGKPDVVVWFYCRNSQTQVFAAVPQDVADMMIEESYADVSYEFTVWVEHALASYCRDNTVWKRCHRYGIDDNELTRQRDDKGRFSGGFEYGCSGYICSCEPFGEGVFRYGKAEYNEFF